MYDTPNLVNLEEKYTGVMQNKKDTCFCNVGQYIGQGDLLSVHKISRPYSKKISTRIKNSAGKDVTSANTGQYFKQDKIHLQKDKVTGL